MSAEKKTARMETFLRNQRTRHAAKLMAKALAQLDPYGYGHPYVDVKLARQLGWKNPERAPFKELTLMDRLETGEKEEAFE